jgi:hypothetical protein
MPVSTSGLSVPQLGQNIDPSVLAFKDEGSKMSLSDMINMGRSATALKKEQALLEPAIEAGKATSRTAQAQATTAEMDVATKKQQAIAGRYVSMINNPIVIKAERDPSSVNKKELADAIQQWGMLQGEETGVDAATALKLTKPYVDLALQKPEALRTFLKERHIAGLDAGTRTSAVGITPQYTTNAAGQIIAITQPTGEINVPGQNAVSPTVSMQGAPSQIQGQFTNKVNPNPTSAEAGMQNIATQNLSTDFGKTQETASSSEPRIALFQNIKKLAPESFTGVGGARKELATGILNAVGIPAYEAEKMSTDELAKSSAMLSLAGGNTDAARLMAEAANPNKKMNEGAIKQIADQMIGMERMNQAKYKFLAPVANNPQEYQNRLTKFNQVNDFRIFQEATADQVKKLKESMSPAEQAKMGEKIKLARSLGLL